MNILLFYYFCIYLSYFLIGQKVSLNNDLRKGQQLRGAQRAAARPRAAGSCLGRSPQTARASDQTSSPEALLSNTLDT